MAHYDIFNGDADGICALVQMRNAFPKQTHLVTGVKRDIKLVQKVSAVEGDELLVLDIAMEKNASGVQSALDAGASIQYFDHHFAGDIPVNDKLETHINNASDVCTAILVNGFLKGAYIEWAIVGAFGDNLKNSALSLAKNTELSAVELEQLEKLGIYINYNGYGATCDDLHFRPEDLYQAMVKFSSPLDFMSQDTETFERLEQGYIEDMASAKAIPASHVSENSAVFMFPDEPWARRVSGVYGNQLANENPDRAHAVITAKASGTYLISVRAPLNNKQGADELCLQFPTGGGRKAAAGVNDLPADQLDSFIDALEAQYAD